MPLVGNIPIPLGHAFTWLPDDDLQDVDTNEIPPASDTENDTVTVPPNDTDDGDTLDTTINGPDALDDPPPDWPPGVVEPPGEDGLFREVVVVVAPLDAGFVGVSEPTVVVTESSGAMLEVLDESPATVIDATSSGRPSSEPHAVSIVSAPTIMTPIRFRFISIMSYTNSESTSR